MNFNAQEDLVKKKIPDETTSTSINFSGEK